MLIVEDDAELSRTLQRAFRDNYEVQDSKDGLMGVETTRTLKPAVIISDQRMPNMTGVELLSKVRELDRRRSGYSSPPSIVQIADAPRSTLRRRQGATESS